MRKNRLYLRNGGGLILMLTALLVAAGAYVSAGEKPQPIRIACVGDSITWGDRLEDREAECYPARLAALMGKGFVVRNFGASGATMRKHTPPIRSYWRKPCFGEAITFAPDVVVIMLGTNDSHRDWFRKDEYVAAYKDMIALFRMLPTKPKIVVCTLPPLFLPESKVPKEIHPSGSQAKLIADTIRSTILEIAREEKVPVVDAYALFEGKEELLPDKIHPGKEGAEMLAQAVKEKVDEVLHKR